MRERASGRERGSSSIAFVAKRKQRQFLLLHAGKRDPARSTKKRRGMQDVLANACSCVNCTKKRGAGGRQRARDATSLFPRAALKPPIKW
jgi:hypothetical protein